MCDDASEFLIRTSFVGFTTMPLRQEVFNILLAQLLQKQGLDVSPEEVLTTYAGKKMPDVLIHFQGLRLIIEGEYFLTPSAAKKAYESAKARVEEGIAHLGIAVLYPKELKLAEFSEAKSLLANANLKYVFIAENITTASKQLGIFAIESDEEINFVEGNISALSESLRRAYEQLITDEVLEKSIQALEEGLEFFSYVVSSQPATSERFRKVLGIGEN